MIFLVHALAGDALGYLKKTMGYLKKPVGYLKKWVILKRLFYRSCPNCEKKGIMYVSKKRIWMFCSVLLQP